MFKVNFDETVNIGVVQAELQDKNITPTKAAQEITADTGYDGLGTVNVAGDDDLVAGNIKDGVSIFGVVGTYDNYPETHQLNITPTKNAQEYSDIYDHVNVAGDGNLKTENIKTGVSIFGVAGSLNPEKPETEITITPTGSEITKTPDTGTVFKKVVVAGDVELKPENIRRDKTVYGVVGTYETEFTLQEKTVQATKDDQSITADTGYDALNKVNISGYELNNQTKSVQGSRQDQTITADDGYDGLDTVNVAGYELNNQAKTVDAVSTGSTVYADAEYDGLSSVAINPIDNLTAENVKDGVQILDITGTLVDGSTMIPQEFLSGELDTISAGPLSEIRDYAFAYCNNLKHVSIDAEVIGDNTFYNVNGLETLSFGESCRQTGYQMLSLSSSNMDCLAGQSVYFPDNLKRINARCIMGTGVKELSLPDGCYFSTTKSTSTQTFQWNYLLEKVVFRGDVYAVNGQIGTSTTMKSFTNSEFASAGKNTENGCVFDFSHATYVPLLLDATGSSKGTFRQEAKIRAIVVPDALYNTWIAATNWSTLADYIVKASEYTEV